MDSLLSLYADLPSWTIPLLAAVPLLVFALVRLRAWELERDRRNLVAWKAGVGKNQLVLEQIYVHPIKSCRGLTDIKEWEYTPLGLEYDRRWALMDSTTHKIVTARDLPKMLLVHPSISKPTKTLSVSIPSANLGPFEVPLDPSEEDLNGWELLDDVRIWSDTTDAFVVSPSSAIHSSLSAFLERDVKLVMKGPSHRSLNPPTDETLYALPKFLPEGARTAFADGFPFLIVTRWSAEDVESKARLSANGDVKWSVKPTLEGADADKWERGEGDYLRRTRGNLVVGGKGGEAWMEDSWGVVDVGEEELVVVSMCGRCQLPNIDPETAIQHPSVPYKLISKFRRSDPVDKFSPCFGVNCVPSRERGVVRVGDKVRVKKLNDWVRQER